MQKDLNVIFPEEITTEDNIIISLVLEKEKSKKDEKINFGNLKEYNTELTVQNFLTKDKLVEKSIIFNKIIAKDNLEDPGKVTADTSVVEIIWEVKHTDGASKVAPGIYEARASFKLKDEAEESEKAGPIRFKIAASSNTPVQARPIRVSMTEARRVDTPDQLLWMLIRNRTIDFNKYKHYMEKVMCESEEYRGNTPRPTTSQKNAFANRLPYHNAASYSLLKYATEYYLMQECGLVPNGIYEDDNDINWDSFNDFLSNEKGIEDEFGRTARSIIDISELKEKYLEELNMEGGYALPYFNLIRQKLQEVQVKDLYALPDVYSIYSKSKPITVNLVNRAVPVPEYEYDAPKVPQACYGIQKSKLLGPCMLELLWSYWHEEAGLQQTMNAISRRFQNIRSNGGKDPLANFNLDPLRPLNNLLWGYIEDERNRLSITRRNLEYQYEYGISLIGTAVPQVAVAEHRTYFIRAFHSLLKATLDFYNQANFTTIIPDGFPLLNHLREVHLLLAEGAHNQYGDLAWTSRVEMLTQQWLLSRPEMREFIGGRIMVPYSEAWMDKVDVMKQLQNWDVPNVTHFHDLAVFGEQLLLSVRFGSWNSTTSVGANNAANWAHYWRNEVQRYVHAYNAVTGVDLGADVTDNRVQISTSEDRYMQPAFLIQKQAALQKSRQQYALQANMAQPVLAQSAQVNFLPPQPTRQPIGQRKLNG